MYGEQLFQPKCDLSKTRNDAQNMDVTYFRPRIEGPELALEDAVANSLDPLVGKSHLPYWVVGSPRIGAGMPDLLFAEYKPQVFSLSSKDFSSTQILAYLRATNGANKSTLITQMRFSEKKLDYFLDDLLSIDAIEDTAGYFRVTGQWLDILPTIISIEVKVTNWKKAITQASRNRIFSHQAYIAVPKNIVDRIFASHEFASSGVGLLSVEKDTVKQESKAKSSDPIVWEYYYRLAKLIATAATEGGSYAVYHPNR